MDFGFVSSLGCASGKSRAAVCGSASSSFAGVAVVPRNAAPVAPPALLPVMPEIEAMRHGKRFKKLNRMPDQRRALLRTLTTEVIRHGRITTTLVRCKELRGYVDHMITLSKEGSLHSRRQAMAWMYDKQLVHALFEQGADRYKDREGGYTRVIRTMPRRGDNAPMGIIELV